MRRRRRPRGWAAGHFYSPIPDLEDIQAREQQVFGQVPPELPGIDLNLPGQLATLEALARHYPQQPWSDEPTPPLRYSFGNGAYGYGDVLVLYGMLRHQRPTRMIEVGSGWSSAATLDVNERFLDGQVELTFIEPDPASLHARMREGDRERVKILPVRLQEVDAAIFGELRAGDVLFIDSTHVSKVDSDVNHLFLEILPRLASGVVVHVHDVFYPFEYPKEWVYEGRYWTENYLLRAFLTFNERFEILFFNDYLRRFQRPALECAMPLFLKNPGGAIWLRRR